MEISASWERTAPPVHFTAFILSKGFGVASGSGEGQPPPAELQEATPEGLASMLGQDLDQVPRYNRPARGFNL